MPAGRPPIKVTKEIIEKAESLAAQGLTELQICHCLGWCQDTLIKKKKQYTELNEAIKRGKSKGIALVTSELLKKIKLGDTTAQIFYLKNRAPEEWRDRRENVNENKHTIEGDLKAALLKDE